MKKRFFLILAAVFASVALHAQFITQMSLLTPHYYPGEVFFKDGHSEEFAELELPRVGKSKLGAKKNAEDKGHIDIEAADIIGIKIWHKDFPDKKHVLYYVHARKSMMQNEHQWGNPVMGSAWGVVFQCEMNYQMDKKTGDLNFIKFVGGNIATAIKKGKLKGSDMQYILDEMAGGKKTEEPAKIIPEIKTDSVSNGVVGDDE